MTWYTYLFTTVLLGIQLDEPAGGIVEAARARGLLVITAGVGDVIRLAPALTVEVEQIK